MCAHEQAAQRAQPEGGVTCSVTVINGSELLALQFGAGEAELRR
jgi:hypothetical protein